MTFLVLAVLLLGLMDGLQSLVPSSLGLSAPGPSRASVQFDVRVHRMLRAFSRWNLSG